MTAPRLVQQIARACAAAGGRAWAVGGSVRDGLLGREIKDWDLEVHGLEDDVLYGVLRPLGGTERVGRSFGVYKVRRAGLEVDVGLPRASALGDTDPHLDLPAAMRRRDLTINAIALDPLTGELTDPTHGIDDLRAGLLRPVDVTTFLDDPLRALRVIQFAPRFGFAVTPELEALCRAADLSHVAPERVGMEIEKLLMKTARPGDGLALGRAWGLFREALPELLLEPADAVDRAVNRAAARREQAGPAPRPYALMLAAMLHALSPSDAERALDRLMVHSLAGYPVRARVLGAVRSWPALAEESTDPQLRQLAETEEVGLVAETALAVTGSAHAEHAIQRAEALGVANAALPPLLFGRDLLALGFVAGPRMGQLLSQVRQAQIQGHVCSPDQAIALVRSLSSTPPPHEG